MTTTPLWLVAWAGAGTTSVLEVTASGTAAAAAATAGPEVTDLGRASGMAPTISSALLDEIVELREDLRAEGADRVVLAGTSRTTRAARVIARATGVPLTVLDGGDPGGVRPVLEEHLDRTVVVVSGAGSEPAAEGRCRAAEAVFAAGGLDPRRRIVVVADPGSALGTTALEAGYRRVFLADPDVGGRCPALGAFGLVPAGLAGADVARLLDDAAAVADLLAEGADANPALALGAALAAIDPGRGRVVMVDAGCELPGFAGWVEQLIVESAGRYGPGGRSGADLVVRLLPGCSPRPDHLPDDVPDGIPDDLPGDRTAAEVTVTGPLGAQLLLWECATALARRLSVPSRADQPGYRAPMAYLNRPVTFGPSPEALGAETPA